VVILDLVTPKGLVLKDLQYTEVDRIEGRQMDIKNIARISILNQSVNTFPESETCHTFYNKLDLQNT